MWGKENTARHKRKEISLISNLDPTSSRLDSFFSKPVILITFPISTNHHFQTSITLFWLGCLVCLYIFNVITRSFSGCITNIPCPLHGTEAGEVRKGRCGAGSRKEKMKKERGFSEEEALGEAGVSFTGASPLPSMIPRSTLGGGESWGLSTRTPKMLQMGNPAERPGTVLGSQYAHWAVIARKASSSHPPPCPLSRRNYRTAAGTAG